MTIEQARAVIADHPLVHVDRHGAPKDGGLNRAIGERVIEELSALENPRIAETGSGLSRMLRPGGLTFIDDVQIFTVAQLVCLLREQQPHYEFISIDSKMAIFRKGLGAQCLPDWQMEPFITSNTATS